MPVSVQTTRLHRVPAHPLGSPGSASPSAMAGSGLFFYPVRQRVAGHAKDSSDPPHTRTLVIGREDLFAAFRAVSWWLRRQDADRATVFAEILLAPAPIMPVFDNVEPATFAAAKGMACCDHVVRFMNDAASVKNIFHHLRMSHYPKFK